jgi:transcriptional regulator with XRE-family HTH domain
MRLGDKIKKIRDLKGLKQEELATLLNISPQAYSKIERNETKLDMERLKQIADIFGVSVEAIEQFDDKNLFFNHMQECKDSVTINNYYNSDQAVFEKIIEQQKELIAQQKEEIAFLRGQLDRLLKSNIK